MRTRQHHVLNEEIGNSTHVIVPPRRYFSSPGTTVRHPTSFLSLSIRQSTSQYEFSSVCRVNIIAFFFFVCVSVSDSRPGGCEFDSQLRRLFFPAYFRFSPLQKHVRKVVGGFGKKCCFSTRVRKPGNTTGIGRLVGENR